MSMSKRKRPAFRRPAPISDGIRVLGVDVSTTCTGLAIMRAAGGRLVADHLGLYRPRASLPYQSRIDHIVDEMILGLPVVLIDPELIVIEWAEGSAWRNNRAWNHTVIPMAAAQGAVRQALRVRYPEVSIEHYSSTQWAQKTPKGDRAKAIAARIPSYREWVEVDKGFDLADAIGIAAWRIGR